MTSTLSPRSRTPRRAPVLRSPLVDAVRAVVQRRPEVRVVALLRGFGRSGRDVRDAVRAALRDSGARLLDLTPVPGLGELADLPPADLVVAASPALSAAATRCAAFWDVPVITPDHTAAAGTACTTQPALTIHRDGGRGDVIVRELRLTGPVRWSDAGGPERSADSLVLRPTARGAVAVATSGAASTTRPLTGDLTIRVAGEVTGDVDGVPHLVVPGEYHARPTAQPVSRISVRA